MNLDHTTNVRAELRPKGAAGAFSRLVAATRSVHLCSSVWICGVILLLFAAALAQAQVYSPCVLRKGQIDARTLQSAAAGICERAGATTPREKAEAIWRFFLTDGRFVEPGFWYHIAGWAYEEPKGEVLDAVKLLNSYGFGLCYHIAPLLEAVWEGAGLDARVWFLTGHTVAEVFYDGAWHHYDSDMMGYTAIGEGDPRKLPVASVRQLERDPQIILGKLIAPTKADPAKVEQPWYPADVREHAIGGLADLFRSAADNRLYAYTRYADGHAMDFVLRPGERLIRFFQPEAPGVFYLPFRYDGSRWSEFPQEIAKYAIRTGDGPRSQKDRRMWATGRMEYTPPLHDPGAYSSFENVRMPSERGRAIAPDRPGAPAIAVFEVTCPWVIIDGEVRLTASLDAESSLQVETSADGGRNWDPAGRIRGPHQGAFAARAGIVAKGAHGAWTAVSGRYAYLVRITMSGSAVVSGVRITTRFQHNPRTLPAIEEGGNALKYSAGPALRRREMPEPEALRSMNARRVVEQGQALIVPGNAEPAELIFEISERSPLAGFDAGGRFVDLSSGEAPDKFTAEVRKTAVRAPGRKRAASIAWAASPAGPYKTLWEYPDSIDWRDGEPVDRLLRWPEVDRKVRDLPAGLARVYVRYRFEQMALDDVRLASIAQAANQVEPLVITHVWHENGTERRHTERIAAGQRSRRYTVTASGGVANNALIFECPNGN